MKKIEIGFSSEQSKWKAVVPVPPSIDWPYPVQGQGTSEGPWAQGFGVTPDAALSDACATIGRAVLRMAEKEATP